MGDIEAILYRALEAALIPVGAVVGTIVSGYLILLLHKLAKHLGLKVEAEQELQIRSTVQNAILGVEEAARARLKTDGATTPPNTKRDEAITVAMERMPKASAADVAILVNEELPKVRASLAPAVVSITE